MKQPLLLTLLFCAFALPVFSQIHDLSLPCGFSISQMNVAPLSGNRWVVLAVGNPQPGSLWADTIFIAITDGSGTLVKRKNLYVPNIEVLRISQVIGTLDGGFVVLAASQECDVSGPPTNIQKYDSEAQLQWEIAHPPLANDPLPSKLTIAQDGNLIGMFDSEVFKIDVSTGTILWTAILNSPLVSEIDDFCRIPGTDNLLAVGSPDFQVWTSDNAPGGPSYALTSSNDTSAFSFGFNVQKGPGNWYYFYDYYSMQLKRVDPANWKKEVVFTPGFNLVDYQMLSDGLLLTGRQNNHIQLVKTGFSGQLIQSHAVSDTWLSCAVLAVQNDSICLAGWSGSGSANSTTPPYYQATDLWIRSMPTFNQPEPVHSKDAALTAVSQHQFIQIDTFQHSFGTTYNFSGGQFQIQLTNKGTEILQSVVVRTGFDYTDGLGCNQLPAKSVEYKNLNLAPGASVWLDFGDVYAGSQAFVPLQCCFWTAAPDGQPDSDHSNDSFCTSYYTTATGSPAIATGWLIYPNPASDGFWIETPKGQSFDGDYQLVNSMGQLVCSGRMSAGINRVLVPTDRLATGIYFLRIGERMEKIVVSH
jgi:hypothetical protein